MAGSRYLGTRVPPPDPRGSGRPSSQEYRLSEGPTRRGVVTTPRSTTTNVSLKETMFRAGVSDLSASLTHTTRE